MAYDIRKQKIDQEEYLKAVHARNQFKLNGEPLFDLSKSSPLRWREDLGWVSDARLGPFVSQELLDKAKSERRGHVFNPRKDKLDPSKRSQYVREATKEASKPFWRP